MSTWHPGVSDEDWPLAPSEAQSAVQLLGAISIAQPYGVLEDEEFRSALVQQVEENAGDPAVPVANSLLEGDRWAALGGLHRLTAEWSQEDRDFAGIPLVLDDGFVPDEAIEADPALYWRSVDTTLEAVGTSYSADEMLGYAAGIMDDLLQEAKSGVMAVATSEGLLGLLSGLHAGQAAFTGFYLPEAEDAVRWGQRKLDGLGDRDLAFALAAEVIQLRMLAAAGHTERVRTYGRLLGDDVHDLSVQRVSGQQDARVKQVAMFTAVLRVVADLLGEDPDGLATDVAPALEGMRLTEARHLAQTQFVTLVERDGRADLTTSERSVWESNNWHVVAQSPGAGARLGAARVVFCWILKGGEHMSSAQQADVRRLSGGPASNPPPRPALSGLAGGDVGTGTSQSLDSVPLAIARSLATSWALTLVEHDGRGDTPERKASRNTDPDRWFVRKHALSPDGREMHVWLLRSGETNLSPGASRQWLDMSAVSGTERPGS